MTEKGSVDIRALARLARLEVSDAEIASLEHELPSILSFVETIQGLAVAQEAKGIGLHNVLRDDVNPHDGGVFTERLLDAAPVRDGDRIAVKQVISRKK